MSGTGKCGGKLNIQDLAEYHLTLGLLFLLGKKELCIHCKHFLFVCCVVPKFQVASSPGKFQAFKKGVPI